MILAASVLHKPPTKAPIKEFAARGSSAQELVQERSGIKPTENLSLRVRADKACAKELRSSVSELLSGPQTLGLAGRSFSEKSRPDGILESLGRWVRCCRLLLGHMLHPSRDVIYSAKTCPKTPKIDTSHDNF